MQAGEAYGKVHLVSAQRGWSESAAGSQGGSQSSEAWTAVHHSSLQRPGWASPQWHCQIVLPKHPCDPAQDMQ